MKNNQIKFSVLFLVVGGLCFLGGIKYQKSKSNTPSNLGQNRQFQGGVGGFGNTRVSQGLSRNGGSNFRPISGEVISQDDKSITVKTIDGSSKIVLFSQKTEYSKGEVANKEEIMLGTKVMIFGTANTDGSVTAQSVQLNPIERRMMGMVTPTGEQIAK